MEVILIKDVEKLGYTNDIVDVAPGYANNWLIPQGYARTATASARKVLAENIKQQAHKEAKLVSQAEAMAAKLAAIELKLTAKAEEGRIFGSITATDIAEALAEKGVEVDRKAINVESVKTVGEYEASVKLYKEIKGVVKFSVSAEE
ncbi:MAG: 50S ribosomal protein L9 [Rikenellaceae bacterium]|jgi:large subunit ribosomal protein L9|nr:50S ribosomal protein L9 [Rikenellaceae bacterium]